MCIVSPSWPRLTDSMQSKGQIKTSQTLSQDLLWTSLISGIAPAMNAHGSWAMALTNCNYGTHAGNETYNGLKRLLMSLQGGISCCGYYSMMHTISAWQFMACTVNSPQPTSVYIQTVALPIQDPATTAPLQSRFCSLPALPTAHSPCAYSTLDPLGHHD